MSFESDLIQNYVDLAASRDWTIEQMADDLEPRDKSLAAELRKHAAGADGKAKSADDSKPRGRRSAPKSEA